MTGFFRQGRGSFTPSAPAPTLASQIGWTPATLNTLPGFYSDGKTLYGTRHDFSTWTLAFASLVTGVIASDSTPTASKLMEDSSNNEHKITFLNRPTLQSIFSPIPYRTMVVAQADGRDRIVIEQELSVGSNVMHSTGFNLTTGQTNYDNVTQSSITRVGTPQMIDLGGGYWCCYYDWFYNGATTYSGGSIRTTVYLDNQAGTSARDISYTGDGASGVNLQMISLLPKNAWDIDTRVFHDDFAGMGFDTIDINNTVDPGYNWYVDHVWPNSGPLNFWGALSGVTTHPPTPSSSLTKPRPSILQIKNLQTGSALTGGLINTIAYGGGTGWDSVVGQYWPGPAIFDGFMSWESQYTGQISMQLPFAFWMVSVETFIQTDLDTDLRYLETDVFEDSTTVGQSSGMIHWDPGHPLASQSYPSTFTETEQQASSVFDGFLQDNPMRIETFRRFTWLFLDSANTGTSGAWGLFGIFIDGTNYFEAVYPMAGGVNATHPPSSLSGIADDIAVASDDHNFMIFLQSVTTTDSIKPAMHIDWVSVWQ